MGRHLQFQPYIIWSAILLGVLGGFGLGAHMVYVLAFGYTPGASFAAMIQVHGHLQLLGWTGLFIIGVSLYKIPRLTSAPVGPYAPKIACACVISGLIVRSAGQLGVFYSDVAERIRLAVVAGTFLESAGILVFLGILVPRTIRYRPQDGAIAAAALKPFVLVSLTGWLLYAAVTAAQGAHYYQQTGALLLDPFWNSTGTEVYIHLVLIPTCLAFSISTFPIFLRLRAPLWRVSQTAAMYFVAEIAALAGHAFELPRLGALGVFARAAAVLWTVHQIDLLRLHGTRAASTGTNRPLPARAGAGDYGQFGNFEWLIYAAYLWLVSAVLLDVANLWMGTLSASLIRHFYLLGFVTHLILGMAVRLVPGFLGKSRIAFPALVRVSFVLITLALFGRTLPHGLHLFDTSLGRVSYGFSGMVGMLALLALGINLAATVFRYRAEERQSR